LDLRDPAKIRAVELQSQYPEVKIRGLKALAMLSAKVSPDLLVGILTTENAPKVRWAIYEIIENSSMGVYADLFDPVWGIFYQCDKEEAVKAFKALVVSGKLPLHTLLEMVRKGYPSLMPMIYNEISKLSRISFFMIQDIALNKEKYLDTNVDINLACVLGMIQKRPERVVRILKKYDNIANDGIREAVTRFVEKTKELLSKEKAGIETEFEPMVQKISQESIKDSGIIRSLFKDPIEKKIERLKKNIPGGMLHFDGEIIKNANLSSCEFMVSHYFFYSCVFDHCDLSRSVFMNADFKKTIFYNTDMRQTQFDSARFDDAIFINVNAEGALFKK
jgi:adenylate cyclase class 1